MEVTKPDFEQRMLEMVEKLNRKADSLATSSSPTLPGGSSTFTNAISKEMKECYDKMKEWKNIMDIVELVRSINCLSLNPLMPNGGFALFTDGEAILCCEVYFILYKD